MELKTYTSIFYKIKLRYDILRIRVGEEHATNNLVEITIEYTKNGE